MLALVTDCDPWSRAVTVGANLAASWGASLTGCYIDPDLWNCSAADSDPSFISLLSGTGSTDSQTLARPGLEFVEYARELGLAASAGPLQKQALPGRFDSSAPGMMSPSSNGR